MWAATGALLGWVGQREARRASSSCLVRQLGPRPLPECLALPLPPPLAGDAAGSSSDDEMDEGEEGGQQAGGSVRRRRGKASEGFKEQVVEVLEKNGFLERRAAKMSQDDFLHLLAVFNQAGIHFV